MRSPIVSVISGYYNRESLVFDSLQSVLDQSFRELELIVFDDCSTDATFDRLREFANQDDRVRIFRNEVNLGFTKSMNLHLRAAIGKYVAVHGSGDNSHPDRLRKQVDFLEAHGPFAVVSCKVKNVHSNGSVTVSDKGNGEITHADLLHSNRFFHGEVMYRRQVFEELGGYREVFRVAADYDLWLRMTKTYSAYVLPDVLYTSNSPAGTLSRRIRNRVDQKINVGYAKQLVKHNLSVSSLEELTEVDLSNDSDLAADMTKLFMLALKWGQITDARYASKSYRQIFGKSIYPAVGRALLG